MASIRKRGNSYLLVVSMGYDPEGHCRKPQQKTVHPPEGLTPKAKEKWLEEEAALFERECKNEPLPVDKSITLAEYTAYWLAHIAPGKLAKSTLARDKQDIDRFLPALGIYKLTAPLPELMDRKKRDIMERKGDKEDENKRQKQQKESSAAAL